MPRDSMQAKNKKFNGTVEKDHLITPFGIILNFIINAFYACDERDQNTVTDQRTLEERETISFNNVSDLDCFKPKVTVTTKKLVDGLKISVKDNGAGIPKGVIDKIFQPSFTTKTTGEGRGLSLSLSDGIVTNGHGGVLNVESKEGEGATFSIELAII